MSSYGLVFPISPQPGVAGTKCRLRTWERGRPARMDNRSGLRPVAGETPALSGRTNPGNPASGSRQPGGGKIFVVLSKISRVRDYLLIPYEERPAGRVEE